MRYCIVHRKHQCPSAPYSDKPFPLSKGFGLRLYRVLCSFFAPSIFCLSAKLPSAYPNFPAPLLGCSCCRRTWNAATPPKLLVNSNRTQTSQPSSGATVYKISSASLPNARPPLPTAHSRLLDRIYAALICPFPIISAIFYSLSLQSHCGFLCRHLETPPAPPSCLLSTALATAAPPRLLMSMASPAFSPRIR